MLKCESGRITVAAELATWTARVLKPWPRSRSSVIGVLPVGYADGYRRGLQHGGEVLVRGLRAPVVGAVCMDLTMVDLTDVPSAAPGDEVILWGGSGDTAISVNDVARLVQTISYELLCTVGRRVPRVYLHGAERT